MTNRYEAVVDPLLYRLAFEAELPSTSGSRDMRPGRQGTFVRHRRDAGGAYSREAVSGRWGLVPHWSASLNLQGTHIAHGESAFEKLVFQDAWKRAQRCVVPVAALLETLPDADGGSARAIQVVRADGEPMGLAGLWSYWKSPTGHWIESFSVLTVPSPKDSLWQRLAAPGQATRMPVILPDLAFEDWLNAPLEQALNYMQPYPAERLTMRPLQA